MMEKPDIDLKEALEFATQTALAAAEIQRRHYESGDLSIVHKGLLDIVTKVDIECEKLITAAIAEKYPAHDIVAEEGTNKKTGNGYVWFIDPLDGTTNYAHGFPMFCPSIGLTFNGDPLVGAAVDPMRDETFTGIKDGGAFLNGNRISVSKVEKMDDALLSTGFPYDIRTNKKNNLDNFNRVAMHCQAVRRPGAAALDLCYVACGRFDGFWEQRLCPWDMAAGVLIVREAGGVVTNMDGKPLDLWGETVVAANPAIHPKLLALVET